MVTIATRAAAKAAGATRYFTGKACKHGHVTERMSSNGACVECHQDRKRDWETKNADHVRAKGRERYDKSPERFNQAALRWRKKNRARLRADQVAYRTEHLEKEKARQKRWRDENPDKEREIAAAWYVKNRHKVAARDARRRAQQDKATPCWDADLTDFAMAEASALSIHREAITGFAWNIDHMIPLQAKLACGLHVWSNLQVIPELLNRRKNNRLELTEPGEWIRYA